MTINNCLNTLFLTCALVTSKMCKKGASFPSSIIKSPLHAVHPQGSLPRIAQHLAYHLHLLRGETPRESGIA